MANMTKKTPLIVVQNPVANTPDPPRSLGNHGRSLWDRIMAEYLIQDSGGSEMLCQAAEAVDLIAALDEEIRRDGLIVHTRGGVRDHPALKHQLAARAFVVRTLHRLGLDVEPLRPAPGRPGRGIGWTPVA